MAIEMTFKLIKFGLLPAILAFGLVLSVEAVPYNSLPGWRTNTAKRLINLNELQTGGPSKDGIPPIYHPRFVSVSQAAKWLSPVEPVVSLTLDGRTRAYPLQILIWHEIVNDRFGDVPVIVTFCPLCYSVNVFDRRINGREYTFGTSGMLRYSNLVMYDHQTESLWQQVIGRALVGDMAGANLKAIPAQIISFEQFRTTYKNRLVLSRTTGHKRNYGRNPYAGYDDIRKSPFMYKGKADDRLRPMEKLVTVSVDNFSKAYPYSLTQSKYVINDEIAGESIVVFHIRGAVSALDRSQIATSREDGSTGVFHREVDGKILTFSYNGKDLVDDQTGSVWDITGKAVSGPLQGKTLIPVVHGDYFAFVWLVFKPETEIYLE